MIKRLLFLVLVTTNIGALVAQEYKLYSPDEKIQVGISNSKILKWSVAINKQPVITDALVSMTLANGDVWGEGAKISSAKSERKTSQIQGFNYKKDVIEDSFNQLTLQCRGNYQIIFRAYNEGVAYRFVANRKDSLVVKNEMAVFNFTADHFTFIPYVNDPHNKDMFQCSFENNYNHLRLSEIDKDTLAFAPVLVELPNNVKAAITEADLEDYPGMFLQSGKEFALNGVFAPYPVEEVQGGHNNLQSFVVKRADYIAKTNGKRSFPWRVVIISQNDKDLLNNDLVYKLASPSRVQDQSWIKPGKVAWDWWNDWNISGVDFRAGINTATYKYYVDFAAANKIENILLDEGWATSTNIMQIVPEINLQEIIDYAKSKGVGVWLWGGWLPLDKQLDHALSTYSKMGVKGFKIDFMDRDDQKMVQFYYRFAKKAAEYKLLVDFHGAYKPTGLQRTYPNVMNFEGVRGLENVKWSNTDFPKYDCSIPFIRMLAGPMDYTPGAMRNANKDNFRAMNSIPMSQGTRCHQLALYVLFESPFEMLCDNPTAYMKEQECLKYMASVPTTFSETVALDGKVSEYAAIARRKNDTWYIGAITDWNSRELTLDLSFLGDGSFEAEVFQDGINADREGSDYKRIVKTVTTGEKLKIRLAPGGGWTARIYPKK
jgi:alpha-glucosidase